MPDVKSWHSHGKLLLTGEYLVLEGAKALAVPINKGQNLRVALKETKGAPMLEWTAWKPDGLWFQAQFVLPELSVVRTSDPDLASSLEKLLKTCQEMAPGFLNGVDSLAAETRLEFDSEFGFGSSSTLISNLAFWAGLDPFSLQQVALGGSGYDIACARSNKPLFYQLVNGKPVTETVELNFPFTANLYFVYLGHKQRTSESIRSFREKAHFSRKQTERITEIAGELAASKTLDIFETLLEEHETILASVLGIVPLKQRLFGDHAGMVKSLGAWGGDFVLMTSRLPENNFRSYLEKKGFNICFPWNDLVLHS